MKRIPYKIADEAAEKITRKLTQEFRHNRLALFDEMNVSAVKKQVHKLYKKAYKIILNEFTAVLNLIYTDVYTEALEMGFDGDVRDLDEGFIEEFFEEYNPVTKYVFKNEIGRKESRLFEAIISSKRELHQSYKTAENLLKKQVRQYAIDLEDAVTKTVYEDMGVQEVEWNAEIDHKTCGVCSEMDGQIFDINDVPPKQHYNCRCWITPVK